mgnify:FL=1
MSSTDRPADRATTDRATTDRATTDRPTTGRPLAPLVQHITAQVSADAREGLQATATRDQAAIDRQRTAIATGTAQIAETLGELDALARVLRRLATNTTALAGELDTLIAARAANPAYRRWHPIPGLARTSRAANDRTRTSINERLALIRPDIKAARKLLAALDGRAIKARQHRGGPLTSGIVQMACALDAPANGLQDAFAARRDELLDLWSRLDQTADGLDAGHVAAAQLLDDLTAAIDPLGDAVRRANAPFRPDQARHHTADPIPNQIESPLVPLQGARDRLVAIASTARQRADWLRGLWQSIQETTAEQHQLRLSVAHMLGQEGPGRFHPDRIPGRESWTRTQGEAAPGSAGPDRSPARPDRGALEMYDDLLP